MIFSNTGLRPGILFEKSSDLKVRFSLFKDYKGKREGINGFKHESYSS